MKKTLIGMLLMVLCLVMAGAALADRMYVLPDSDVRKLTRAEVEQWDYESLGYAFNEIFARHGYVFNPGQAYDYYFSAMPWYTPNMNPNNQQAVYPYISDIEWYNYDLIKSVRAAKKYNDWGLSIWDNFSFGFQALQGFDYIRLQGNQVLYVYSAPGTSSWRGANGKAEVSTNGAVYAAGLEGSWMLVMYETNNGSVRVGYVDRNKIRGNVPVYEQLNFAYDSATVTSNCTLTDDPARTGSAITTLRKGATVTYLTRFYNHTAWDYVETRVNGKTVRGFVRSGSLDINMSADPLENLNYSH